MDLLDSAAESASRSVLDLSAGLTEEQLLVVGAALEDTVRTPGWRYILQLVARTRMETVEMIHDTTVPKDYVSGMLKALAAIPNSAKLIMERAAQVRKAKQEAQEAAQARPVVLPFVRPGSGSPAA